MMTTVATCTSLLLATCVPGLSGGAGPYFGRGDESEFSSEYQTMEVFIDEAVPRYISVVEDVAVEAGGALGIGAEPYVWNCDSTSSGLDVRSARYYIPLINFDDLRRIIADGAQRYGYGYTAGPVPRDKDKRRNVVLDDQDGNLLSSHHLEDDTISVFFDSRCLSASQPDGISQYLRFPEPEELFSRVTIVGAYDTNEQRNPLIFRQVTTGSNKKPGS